MRYTLASFYHSDAWRKLNRRLKLERANDDGEVICEYCGKPITRAYDCIGHHKEHLTEENVNDLTISLNPDNIALVHHRCHNFIHDKLAYSHREVFLVYGPPLAGKTTFVRNAMSPGDLIVDLDDIWQCVSGQARYVKPAVLKSIVFRVRNDLIDAVKYRAGKWRNAYIVGGYPLRSERDRLVDELGAREIFIDATEAECMARLEADAERDHEEWSGYIRSWYERYTPPVD